MTHHAAVEAVAAWRERVVLGDGWDRALLDFYEQDLHQAPPSPRPLVAALSHRPAVTNELRILGLDAASLEDRDLAVVVGELAPTIGLALWGAEERPTGIVEWWPPKGFQRVFGQGLLMDRGARQALARRDGSAELWVVGDVLDYLTIATYFGDADEKPRGVIAVVDRPWPHAFGRKLPPGCSIVVAAGRVAPRVIASLRRQNLKVRPWHVRDSMKECV